LRFKYNLNGSAIPLLFRGVCRIIKKYKWKSILKTYKFAVKSSLYISVFTAFVVLLLMSLFHYTFKSLLLFELFSWLEFMLSFLVCHYHLRRTVYIYRRVKDLWWCFSFRIQLSFKPTHHQIWRLTRKWKDFTDKSWNRDVASAWGDTVEISR
jgi:hypothetical protein